MKILKSIFVFGLISCASCLHFNYAVKRDGSPVPFENLYAYDDKDAYEFSSVLYASEADFPRSGSYVEIRHMTDLQGPYSSTLSFSFRDQDHLMLIVESVVLKHFDQDGHEILALSKSDTLAGCSQKIKCNAHLGLQYPKRLPKKIVETISFSLIINGEKKDFFYEIPLEYKYEYLFFDVMMGV